MRVDVGLGTPASIHLLYKRYPYQSLCFAGQHSGEQTEVVPVRSSAGKGGQVVTVQWAKCRILSAPPGGQGRPPEEATSMLRSEGGGFVGSQGEGRKRVGGGWGIPTGKERVTHAEV